MGEETRCLVTLVHLPYFFLKNAYVWCAQATISSLTYGGWNFNSGNYLFTTDTK